MDIDRQKYVTLRTHGGRVIHVMLRSVHESRGGPVKPAICGASVWTTAHTPTGMPLCKKCKTALQVDD